VPLDTNYPADRVKYMIEDSAIAVLVTTAEGCAALSKDKTPAQFDRDRPHRDRRRTRRSSRLRGSRCMAPPRSSGNPRTIRPWSTAVAIRFT
jgi:non-ribosomal peptide synthetase component F